MDDRGSLTNLGHLQHSEAGVIADLECDGDGRMYRDAAREHLRILVVRDGRTSWADVGFSDARPEVCVERLDHGRDVLWLVAARRADQFRNSGRSESLDHHAVNGGAAAILNGEQPRFHSGQPSPVSLDLNLDLCLAELEHSAKLRRGYLVGENPSDLVQREAEFLQGNDPIQLGELACAVVAVAGVRIDARRTQQPDGVIVAKHPDRDAAVASEVSDAEHGPYRSSP